MSISVFLLYCICCAVIFSEDGRQGTLSASQPLPSSSKVPQVDIAGLVEFLADGTDMPERSQLAARGEYDEAIRPRARLADEERMGDVHVGPRRVMRAIAFAAHLEPDQREVKRDGIDGAMRPAEQTGAAAPHPPEFFVLAGCVDAGDGLDSTAVQAGLAACQEDAGTFAAVFVCAGYEGVDVSGIWYGLA